MQPVNEPAIPSSSPSAQSSNVPVRYEHHARIVGERIHEHKPRSPFSWIAEKLGEKFAAIVQIISGLLIALAGIPMLILPGPGLLAIFGGLAMAGKGVKKFLGIKEKQSQQQ